MLSMAKEHSYNGVIANMNKTDRTTNSLEYKVGRYDRGNVDPMHSDTRTKTWVNDNTMRMR